jgi:hypothetical protein
MWGRRFTRSGWLQLSALTLAVLTLVFFVFAPVATVSVSLDLPPASATPEPTPVGEVVQLAGMQAVGFVVIGLAVGVVAALVWLVIWTARRIIRAQPKSDS